MAGPRSDDRFRIVQTTRFSLSEEVHGALLKARLLPRRAHDRHCEFDQLIVRPPAAEISESEDSFGNRVSRIALDTSFQRLELSAISVISGRFEEIRLPSTSQETTPWERLCCPSDPMALDSARITRGPAYAGLARDAFGPDRNLGDALRDFAASMGDRLEYDTGAADRGLHVREVLERRVGVCQDFAHLAIASLRSLGLPVRFVSGYRFDSAEAQLEVEPHAWAAVRVSHDRWLDFDPTHGDLCEAETVTLAWGRDSEDVPLIEGRLDREVSQTIESRVFIERLT